MSNWITIVVGCGLLAAIGPESALASPSPDYAPVMKQDDGLKRPGLPIEGVLTNPNWISRPSDEDMTRFYPGLANLMLLPGRVELHCTISALGMMNDCKVVQELPSGLGFAAAALRMAALFRMKPMTVDGVPVGGSTVNIPISFMMEPSPPASNPAPTAAASPTAIALARRLVVAARGTSDGEYVDKNIGLLEEVADGRDAAGDVDGSVRQAAFDALRLAFAAQMPRFTDLTASAMVGEFSEGDLGKIVDFAESPAGHRWFSKQAAMLVGTKADFMSVWDKIQVDAVARFCAQRTCAPSRKEPPTPP